MRRAREVLQRAGTHAQGGGEALKRPTPNATPNPKCNPKWKRRLASAPRPRVERSAKHDGELAAALCRKGAVQACGVMMLVSAVAAASASATLRRACFTGYGSARMLSAMSSVALHHFHASEVRGWDA